MMKLTDIEQQLREALGADRLEESGALVERYREAFDETWAAIPEQERASSPLPAHAADLMRWAISMTAAIRSASQAQRKVIRALRPYSRNGQQHTTMWRTQG